MSGHNNISAQHMGFPQRASPRLLRGRNSASVHGPGQFSPLSGLCCPELTFKLSVSFKSKNGTENKCIFIPLVL
jgi:hypothetical protein